VNSAEFETKSLPEKLRAASANEGLWGAESDAIESAADLLESLRGECAELMNLCNRYANQATNAETERDEALQKIKAAPHQYMVCQTYNGAECSCWKAGL
jgi:hypothetical protein